jgi:predicted nuclease of restriction endonuclease-like (RecB) superfamily
VAQPPARRAEQLPADYPQFLAEVKARIAAARTRAVLGVNSELVKLYWEIGHEILDREQREGWGAKVIDRLAADLRREFPDMTGLSLRNLRYMRAFARAWPAEESSAIVQQVVAQLPWGHNVTLLDKLGDQDFRLWYAARAVENGWSRNVLQAQIATDLRGRQGNALTSFDHALPESDSELVRDAIKDPYNFEFLGLSRRAKERDLELALLDDIQSFLMEMGRGFALVGRQFPLKIVDEDTGEEQAFFIDLLFYNYILRRFVVIDLKIEDFKPELAGKMGFYLTAVDELERQEGDEPSIGLVLCPGRSRTVTEWALRSIDTPVAVARYTTGEVRLTQTPPAEMKPALPDLPALASELSNIVEAANAVYDDEGPATT